MTVAAKPCGFRTHLGNRFAIPTLPQPRRLLEVFNTKSRKELSSAIPSGFLQAHPSISKDSPPRGIVRQAGNRTIGIRKGQRRGGGIGFAGGSSGQGAGGVITLIITG